ncbi:RDD family protein [Amphibacillus indicireducens]|uniref:RDD domain-containing protein n=1 Tax=Amphibacillus indicireducens TaxID=1076330 RepID=A0ABP7V6D9_9BACI
MLEQSEIKTPEHVTVRYSYAGLGSRAIAFMIDQFIIGLVYFLIFIGLFFIFESQLITANFDQLFLWVLAGAVLLVFAIEWSYFVLFEFFWNGKTIGKKIIGIRVMKDNGHRLTLLSSIIRNLMRIVDELSTSYLIGILLIFFHAENKRLGDLTAGTIVVHDRERKRKPSRHDPIGKVLRMNGWTEDDYVFDSFLLSQLQEKDFQLVETYCKRYLTLPDYERDHMTRKVAEIILPKLGIDTNINRTREVEQILFVLYLNLRDEWSY